MVDKEEKILKRDDKLLKNEKLWRRTRIVAICFTIIFILILVGNIIIEYASPGEQKENLPFMFIVLLICAHILSGMELRLGHIESIKLYRKKESEAVME
ncbi:MAG: hypothetical protein ACYS67_11010 [Planctomycetota bacterium]|jgi:hypothetical protein